MSRDCNTGAHQEAIDINTRELEPKRQEVDKKSIQLEYLIDMYKIFHGNINTMFNYFLLLSGLIINAFIQSIQRQADINRKVSASIAAFGAAMSVISLLINIRSSDMLYTLEDGLISEEKVLFRAGGGVFTRHRRRSWSLRYKYLFPITYASFIIAFLLMFAYSCGNYLNLLWSVPR